MVRTGSKQKGKASAVKMEAIRAEQSNVPRQPTLRSHKAEVRWLRYGR